IKTGVNLSSLERIETGPPGLTVIESPQLALRIRARKKPSVLVLAGVRVKVCSLRLWGRGAPGPKISFQVSIADVAANCGLSPQKRSTCRSFSSGRMEQVT